MTLKDLRLKGVTRINRLRRVQRLLESGAFAAAWSMATEQTRKEIEAFIYLGDLTLLEKFVETNHDLETMSLRQLREKASAVGVPYYARLGKSELLWEIANAESGPDSENHEHQNGNGTVGDSLGKDHEEEVRCPVRQS